MFGKPIPTTGMTYADRERLMHECHREVERLREASCRGSLCLRSISNGTRLPAP